MAGADAIAGELLRTIMRRSRESEVGGSSLLINGFGGTPLIELYVMYNSTRWLLERLGVRVVRSLVGNFVTSLDMAGCSVTVCLLDPEMVNLWDNPVRTAALHW